MNSKGFTLIELIVTMAIIVIITSFIFFNYNSFVTNSILVSRASQLSEFLRFAQETSSSAELFSGNVSTGYQIVRVKVRKGLLDSFRLEKIGGNFAGFSDSGIFATARNTTVSDIDVVNIPDNEKYHVDVCYIDIDGTNKYNRKMIEINSDSDCSTNSMLCSEPNLSNAQNNNFDIHFSIQQPTREPHSNIIPISYSSGTETYNMYSLVEPNGQNVRESLTYEGVRFVLISDLGLKNSIDVYQTGLISTKSVDTSSGCN